MIAPNWQMIELYWNQYRTICENRRPKQKTSPGFCYAYEKSNNKKRNNLYFTKKKLAVIAANEIIASLRMGTGFETKKKIWYQKNQYPEMLVPKMAAPPRN